MDYALILEKAHHVLNVWNASPWPQNAQQEPIEVTFARFIVDVDEVSKTQLNYIDCYSGRVQYPGR